jgi:hypothetical protein
MLRDSTSLLYLSQLLELGDIEGGGASPLSYQVMQILLDLQTSHQFSGDLVEIGVFQGHTLALLAAASGENERVMGIDVDHTCLDESYRRIVDVCQRYTLNPDLRNYHGSSSLPGCRVFLEKNISAYGIRFAHIDGEHSREMVLNDARVLSEFMAPWGLMCFDDMFSIASPSVTQGMFEFESQSDWTPILLTPNKGYLCRERYFQFYRHILSGLPEYLRSARDLPVALSVSSYFPDQGFLSIWPSSTPYYQVISRGFQSYDEFIAYTPPRTL